MDTKKPSDQTEKLQDTASPPAKPAEKEIGGFEKRLEPTRYGDWDVNGRCSDF